MDENGTGCHWLLCLSKKIEETRQFSQRAKVQDKGKVYFTTKISAGSQQHRGDSSTDRRYHQAACFPTSHFASSEPATRRSPYGTKYSGQ